MKNVRYFCIILALVLVFFSTRSHAGCYPMPIPPFFFCTLDEEGTGTAAAPDYYICSDPLDFERAGGTPSFSITMNGWCGVHPGSGLAGWTPIDWKYIRIDAAYNYTTKRLTESFSGDDGQLIVEEMTCDTNPYASEVYSPPCSFTNPMVNNTNAEVNGPYPFSIRWMDFSVRQAIAKWEETKDEGDPLEDWDPLAESQDGQSGMEIQSPDQYQIIPENSGSFSIEVAMKPGETVPQSVELQWQQIIPAPEWVGDIRLPEGSKYWWQPFFGPSAAQWADFPLEVSVTPGYFTNKPGLYEIRLRDANKGGWWSAPVRFWIGNPTFEPPLLLQFKDVKKVMKTAGGKTLKKTETMRVSSKMSSKLKTVKKAHLKVTKVNWNDSAKPGNDIDLVITVANQGLVASEPNQYKLFVACIPEGECTQTEPASIPVGIEPGGTYTFTLGKGVRPERASTRFFVSTKPMNIKRLKKGSILPRN